LTVADAGFAATVKSGATTETAIADDIDAVVFALPTKVAVIDCEPAGSAVVASVATPALRAADPRLVVPLKNVTEPTGEGAPVTTEATVALSVTDDPSEGCVLETLNDVVVAAGVTVYVGLPVTVSV
jgi:hypothetical protein